MASDWQSAARAVSVMMAMALAGCAHQLAVTYSCDPPGATLFEPTTGQSFPCPTTLYYEINQAQLNQHAATLSGLTARWVSGATKSVPQVNVNLGNGFSQQMTFVRPLVPGAQIDANYALGVQRNRIMEERNAIMQRRNDPVQCIKYPIGTRIYTQCSRE